MANGDSTSLVGFTDFLNTDELGKVDLTAMEQKIMNRIENTVKKVEKDNLLEEFERSMKNIIDEPKDLDEVSSKGSQRSSKSSRRSDKHKQKYSIQDIKHRPKYHSSSSSASVSDSGSGSSGSGSYTGSSSYYTGSSSYYTGSESGSSRRSSRYSKKSYKDHDLANLTEEERKRRIAENALKGISGDYGATTELTEISEQEQKISLLSEIDELRNILREEGVKIDNIPVVSVAESLREIRSNKQFLVFKIEMHRCRGFAEDFIIMGSKVMEIAFDGKKEYFGYKPNLDGWSDTVAVKLRRLRYESTSLVSGFIKENNISPLMRIIMELAPSMFLHSSLKSKQSGDSLYDKKAAMQNDYQRMAAIDAADD